MIIHLFVVSALAEIFYFNMAKKKNQKQNIVDKYKTMLSDASGVYFFSGSLNATNTQGLKSALTGDTKLTLIKNTLFNLASNESGIELKLEGYNNAIFVDGGLIENASKLSKFLGENELEATKVVIGKSVYDGSKLKQIAGLVSEATVYTRLVGIMNAPATTLVRDLLSPMQKLVYVLSQIQK